MPAITIMEKLKNTLRNKLLKAMDYCRRSRESGKCKKYERNSVIKNCWLAAQQKHLA